MIPFIDLVRDSGKFQAMISMLEPLMTQPQFPKYFTPAFNETRDWKGIEKVIGRIPIASLIDPHSGKPLINTDKPAFMYGQLPHWGDSIAISSDEIVELQRLENYIASNVVSITGQKADQSVIEQLTDQRTQLLLKRFNPIARMPLAAMDKIAFEEWSNGTATIDKTKNAAKVPFSIDFEVHKYHVPKVWSDKENATGLADLDAFVQKVWKTQHFRVKKLALNPDEFRKLLLQKSSADIITSYISNGNRRTKVTGVPAAEDLDVVLQGQYKLPPLSIIDPVVDIRGANGNIDVPSESYNAFLDGRVGATIGNNLGKYMYTLSPEQRMPDDDYKYAVAAYNVLLAALSKKGNLSIDTDLCALPVLTGRNSMAILVTDDTKTGDPIY